MDRCHGKRPWSGRRAGRYRNKALNAAATQAGIENYSIIGYPEKENIFASLLGNQKKTLYKQRN